MKMKKIYILFIMLIFISCNLFSIGFGFHVFEVRTTPDFANGFFPTSVLYRFDFPIPNFVSGNSTMFAVSFDNGLEYRTLSQHPDTGYFFENNKDASWFFDSREYSTHYDEFLLIFKQGFGGQTSDKKDHFSIGAAIGGRFERSFERLSWLYDSSNLNGVFHKSATELRYPDSLWLGQPELAGDRNTFQTFVDVLLNFNYMNSSPTIKNGVSSSLRFRISPEKMLVSDGSSDFYSVDVSLSLAYTPFSVQQINRDLTWFSIVMGNDFNYSFIYGSKIPYYASNEYIYGSTLPNTNSRILNRTYISFFGPQIYAKDLYPVISVFNDIGFSFGNALNSINDKLFGELAASFGFKAEFIVYDIFSLFYEVGFLYKKPFEDIEVSMLNGRFGITIEV